jgi:gliding motility-associated-like protein
VNDYFEIFGNKSVWNYLDIKIFDRWGEKVFESYDLYFQWDGTYRGVLQQPGVYVYILDVGYIDGHNTGTLKGSITLIR